jgi:hypothetical protein
MNYNFHNHPQHTLTPQQMPKQAAIFPILVDP